MRLYLVRHARPAAAWGQDPDPGLDEVGTAQARECAQSLHATIAPLPIYTSPLRRCRETAAPLAALWQRDAIVLPAVAEIPSPPIATAARREWLTRTLAGTWTQMYDTSPAGSIDYHAWRQALIDALLGLEHDCIICTHYIAINVAVGAALGCPEVLCIRPDHASVTIVESRDRQLHLIERGREAQTSVLTRH